MINLQLHQHKNTVGGLMVMISRPETELSEKGRHLCLLSSSRPSGLQVIFFKLFSLPLRDNAHYQTLR